jgi:hypothetical protein
MRPRDRLIDLFSTFARLEDDRFRQWIGDPRLQRSMERQLTNAVPTTSADERLWGVYWHQQHTNHPLAQSHLTAYLQEPCFWVAQEMSHRLQTSQYTLADYFQLTNIEVPRVLKSFSPERSSNLKTYAKMVLTNALKDLLRQRQAADVCSNWSLLRKVSKKRVEEVLSNRGMGGEKLPNIAWRGFVSKPSTFRQIVTVINC